MSEFFIVANSFAAPFVSDRSEKFVEAETPEQALGDFAKSYSHPAHLFAADCYSSADAFHKGEKALARWLCNHEIARQAATKDKSCFSYEGVAPGRFKIDGQVVIVEGDPYSGKLVSVL